MTGCGLGGKGSGGSTLPGPLSGFRVAYSKAVARGADHPARAGNATATPAHAETPQGVILVPRSPAEALDGQLPQRMPEFPSAAVLPGIGIATPVPEIAAISTNARAVRTTSNRGTMGTPMTPRYVTWAFPCKGGPIAAVIPSPDAKRDDSVIPIIRRA